MIFDPGKAEYYWFIFLTAMYFFLWQGYASITGFLRFSFTSPVASYFLLLMVPAFFQVILYIEKTSTSLQYCALSSWPKAVSFICLIAMIYQTAFLLILNISNDKSLYDWLEHSFFSSLKCFCMRLVIVIYRQIILEEYPFNIILFILFCNS